MHLTKRRAALAAMGVFLVGLVANSVLVEPAMIEIRTVEIPGTGTEMTIAFLSDFQRRDADPAFVQRAVDIANAQNPDLVLLGGDYVERSADELGSVEPLKNLRSKYGIYGVMGNHDYLAFGFARDAGGDAVLAEKIIQFLEGPGLAGAQDGDRVKILRNEKVVIDGRVTLVGLDELWAHLRDESKAHSDGDDAGYKILLSHNQDELEIKKDTADLYLFGHTHCGQVRLPGLGSVPKLLGFSGEYDRGHYVLEDGAHVYTTCGLTPAPRLLNPPEVSIIRLIP